MARKPGEEHPGPTPNSSPSVANTLTEDGRRQVGVPEQLRGLDLIRVCSPDCGAHNGCENPGKRPVYSVEDVRPNDEITEWISNSGNVGVVTTGDLLVLDIDSGEFRGLVDDHLPATFTVRSGSGGEHRYYRCSWSENRKFGPLGSIRANNWQVVIPPSRHPSGNRYRVVDNRAINSIPETAILSLIEAATDDTGSQHAAAAAGRVGGGSSDPEIPDEYPGREAEWTTLKRWLSANDLLDRLSQRHSSDWSGDEFVIAKCLAEGGFAPSAISSVLDRFNPAAKWHRRDEQYRTRTVRKAIVAACNDEYVDLSKIAYKPGIEGERRKTESSVMGLSGGDGTMADDGTEFTVKERVNILEATEDGDSFRDVTVVEGNDNGDRFEFVQLRKGRVEMQDTLDHGEVKALNVYDRKSLGSPEYLDDLIEGLTELRNEIEDGGIE
jgi:hypothetical protein